MEMVILEFLAGTQCNVSCNTVKLNVYLERSKCDQKIFIVIKNGRCVDYNTEILYIWVTEIKG